MYADYAYYQGTYHGVALTEEQWPAAAREADAWIDRLTLGRLRHGAPVDDACAQCLLCHGGGGRAVSECRSGAYTGAGQRQQRWLQRKLYRDSCRSGGTEAGGDDSRR